MQGWTGREGTVNWDPLSRLYTESESKYMERCEELVESLRHQLQRHWGIHGTQLGFKMSSQ